MARRTIKTRMENGQITNPEQFKEDTLLTFQNAMKYNPPTNDVHIMAKTLVDYFHSKWDHQEAAIMDKWRAGADPNPRIIRGLRPRTSGVQQNLSPNEKSLAN